MTEKNYFKGLENVKKHTELVEQLLKMEIKQNERDWLEGIVEQLEKEKSICERMISLDKEIVVVEAERSITETEEDRKKRLEFYDFYGLPLKRYRKNVEQQEKSKLDCYKIIEKTFPGSDPKALELIANDPILGIYFLIKFIHSKYEPLSGEYDYLKPEEK